MTATPLSALQLPRTPDPREAPTLRWGILGPGWIAHRFVESLQRHTNQQVVAVGSRDEGRARAFAAQWSAPRAHASCHRRGRSPGRVLHYREEAGGQTDGPHYAVAEAARLIAGGALESEIHPLGSAISTLEVADEIRRQLAN